MTPEQYTEFLLLNLRDAIATKEGYIACANNELAQGGWQSAWNLCIQDADVQIEQVREAIRNL